MDTIIEEIYDNTNSELEENRALLQSMEARMEEMAREINRLKDQQDQLLRETQPTPADTTVSETL